MKNIIKQYKIVLPTLLIGLLVGWVLFHNGGKSNQNGSQAEHNLIEDGSMWTCSMHPQIKQDKKGLCPICAMDLIPLETMGGEGDGGDPNELSMSIAAIKLAEIQTYMIRSGSLEKVVYVQGKVTEDERNVAEVTARFGGRIENLLVNFTGEKVSKGQKLANIFSPDIIVAQKELQEAAMIKETRPALYEAARRKLLLWSLSEEQISKIETTTEALTSFEILSPISGVVTIRHIALGDYVKVGEPLFRVVDLTNLWIQFDAYESDLPWINVGDKVTYSFNSLPGQEYSAKIEFIDPVINAKTRVAKVRLNIENSLGELKPEMFARGKVESKRSGDKHIKIPKTAVLWTGKRSVVYTQVPDRENPAFLMKKIQLGVESGDYYEVIDGLDEGETVVVNGVFKIDAAAQLIGLPSMMNPDEGRAQTGHNHGEVEAVSEMEPMDHSNHIADVVDKPDSSQQSENMVYRVDPLFQLSLNDLYSAYLPMKDAFVLTHGKKVRKAGKKLQPVLEAIDMTLLDGDAHIVWMGYLQLMKTAIEKIVLTKDIEKQRLAFSDFNAGFYKAIKSFGLNDQKIYYQFCPMAFNDQGAYWMSNEEIIANPYFGDVMLRCGEVKEIIEN